MSNSDQSTGYPGGIIAGFISFSLFGIASLVVFCLVGVKSPTDRTFEGDFSAKRIAQRSSMLETVTAEQTGSVDQSKLNSAISKFKAAPEAKTSIAFPGSATALEALKQKTPVAPPKPKAPKKVEPKPAAPAVTPEEAPKAPKTSPEKPAAAPKGKGKAEGKGKTNPKAKAKPKAKAPAAPAPKDA